ncbi:MAG: M28 family peptidase [Caldilineaceae bacterium]
MHTDAEVFHVLGHLPAVEAQSLGERMIVVLAQYDMPPPSPDGVFFPGANDNASGVALMLEVIRTMQETGYRPYKTFLFVAYAGEGTENGNRVNPLAVEDYLEAKLGFAGNFDIEAIVDLRGVGGSGNPEDHGRLAVSPAAACAWPTTLWPAPSAPAHPSSASAPRWTSRSSLMRTTWPAPARKRPRWEFAGKGGRRRRTSADTVERIDTSAGTGRPRRQPGPDDPGSRHGLLRSRHGRRRPPAPPTSAQSPLPKHPGWRTVPLPRDAESAAQRQNLCAIG